MRLLLFPLLFGVLELLPSAALSQSCRATVLRGVSSVIVDYGMFTEAGLPPLDTVAMRTKMELELRGVGLVVTAFSPAIT